MIWSALMAALVATVPDNRPMPVEAEPAMNRYGQCLQSKITNDARDFAVGAQRDFPRLMDEAIIACRTVRDAALDEAAMAVVQGRRFPTLDLARAFLTTRMDELDGLFRSIARGEGDPDNYAED